MTEDRGVIDAHWQQPVTVVGLDVTEVLDDLGRGGVWSRQLDTLDHEIGPEPALIDVDVPGTSTEDEPHAS